MSIESSESVRILFGQDMLRSSIACNVRLSRSFMSRFYLMGASQRLKLWTCGTQQVFDGKPKSTTVRDPLACFTVADRVLWAPVLIDWSNGKPTRTVTMLGSKSYETNPFGPQVPGGGVFFNQPRLFTSPGSAQGLPRVVWEPCFALRLAKLARLGVRLVGRIPSIPGYLVSGLRKNQPHPITWANKKFPHFLFTAKMVQTQVPKPRTGPQEVRNHLPGEYQTKSHFEVINHFSPTNSGSERLYHVLLTRPPSLTTTPRLHSAKPC